MSEYGIGCWLPVKCGNILEYGIGCYLPVKCWNVALDVGFLLNVRIWHWMLAACQVWEYFWNIALDVVCLSSVGMWHWMLAACQVSECGTGCWLPLLNVRIWHWMLAACQVWEYFGIWHWMLAACQVPEYGIGCWLPVKCGNILEYGIGCYLPVKCWNVALDVDFLLNVRIWHWMLAACQVWEYFGYGIGCCLPVKCWNVSLDVDFLSNVRIWHWMLAAGQVPEYGIGAAAKTTAGAQDFGPAATLHRQQTLRSELGETKSGLPTCQRGQSEPFNHNPSKKVLLNLLGGGGGLCFRLCAVLPESFNSGFRPMYTVFVPNVELGGCETTRRRTQTLRESEGDILGPHPSSPPFPPGAVGCFPTSLLEIKRLVLQSLAIPTTSGDIAKVPFCVP